MTYQHKHNIENGENNRDGSDQNYSWNCGAEGPTQDIAIHELRERQLRNFWIALLLSQGIPMILMGDEIGHTAKEITIPTLRIMKSIGSIGKSRSIIIRCSNSFHR